MLQYCWHRLFFADFRHKELIQARKHVLFRSKVRKEPWPLRCKDAKYALTIPSINTPLVQLNYITISFESNE